jgi:CRISPR-associated endonuclease/helicase Cas3
MFIAHSQNEEGSYHLLVDHLQEVARLSQAFASKFGAGELGYWAGLWHDLGKFSQGFQNYIKNTSVRRRGPDHSSAGAVHAFRSNSEETQALAFLIAGHHSGIPNMDDLKYRLRKTQKEPLVQEALKKALGNFEALSPSSPLADTLPEFVAKAQDKRTWDLFLRMLFSAMKDADFLDTEAHFHPQRLAERKTSATLEELGRQFEAYHSSLTVGEDTVVNRVRHRVYQLCLAASSSPQGVFRLTAPTGGGKTLSSMGFALRHALAHGLDRIIVAIPYTSIIEQTATVYRSIFGEDAVLEHHSEVEWPDEPEDLSPQAVWMRLASENWDAPIVVTTTVQLFDSLFSNRTSACRKLHNIARSVIILDEVQTLPPHLLDPILDVIQSLSRNYRVSVVLSSATLPAYQASAYTQGLEDMREIVPEPERFFAALKRVSYDFPEEQWGWDRVAEEMRSVNRCMAVVNTKGDAMRLLDALDDPEAYHLSTLLYGAHRRRVLSEIRDRLRSGDPCRLIATQVVEAGVDLDFPMVLRAIGPLDRVVQAAGRCNREGSLTEGKVVVFDPVEGGMPWGDYKTGADLMRSILASGERDLDSPQVHRLYFDRLFQNVNLDSRGIQALRAMLAFEAVAQRFHLIDDATAPVVVSWGPDEEKAQQLIQRIKNGQGSPLELIRRLGPYLVNVRQREIERLQRQGLVAKLTPSLWEWRGLYDSVRGIGQGTLDPDALVVL